MLSVVWELELRQVKGMSREDLIQGIRQRGDALPTDLHHHFEERPIQELRLLLLAARLLFILRQLPTVDPAGRLELI